MSRTVFSNALNKLPVNVIRFMLNCWPPFRGAGIKVESISPDYRTFVVSLKLGLFNRNLVGVHFGGSLFAMVDAFYMIILTKNLGKEYIVWDKAASIDYKKPGRGTIKATCSLTEDEISAIRSEANKCPKYIFDKKVDLLNDQNEIVATVIKTLYVKRKNKKE